MFFYVLLPVIMFDAGFGLDTRMWVAARDWGVCQQVGQLAETDSGMSDAGSRP